MKWKTEIFGVKIDTDPKRIDYLNNYWNTIDQFGSQSTIHFPAFMDEEEPYQ